MKKLADGEFSFDLVSPQPPQDSQADKQWFVSFLNTCTNRWLTRFEKLLRDVPKSLEMLYERPSREGIALLNENARVSAAGALAATVGVIADQWSKEIAFARIEQGMSLALAPVLSVTPGMNEGVAFGIANGTGPWLLIGVALLVTGWLMVLLIQSRSLIEGVALGAAIGGALANVVDRFLFGAVRDFIDVHWNSAHWPTFNLADVFVVTGLFGYFIIDHLNASKRSPGAMPAR